MGQQKKMKYGKNGKARREGYRENYDKDALKENKKHIREKENESLNVVMLLKGNNLPSREIQKTL